MKKVLGLAVFTFYVFGFSGIGLAQTDQQVKSDPTKAMKSISTITAGAKDPQTAAQRIESMKRIAAGLKKLREMKEGKQTQ